MSENSGDDKSAGEFIPIGDPQEAIGLLAEAFRNEAPAIFWTADQELLLRATMQRHAEDDRFFAVQLEPGFELRAVIAKLRTMKVPTDCHFSVSLSRANILFRSTWRGADSTELHFDRPKKIFKVQRRKDLRIDIREGYLLKIEFSHPQDALRRMIRKCHDISAGGLSFLIDPADAIHYPLGTVLTQISFTLNGRKVRADGEVRHCRPLRTRSQHKVGIQFRNISAADAQHVARHVFDENVRRMSRYL